jgi:hypothetical protein
VQEIAYSFAKNFVSNIKKKYFQAAGGWCIA